MAGPLHMSVTLLRVLEPVPPVVGDCGRPVLIDDLPARARDAEEYLAPLAAMLRARGIDASWSIRRGRVDTEILRPLGRRAPHRGFYGACVGVALADRHLLNSSVAVKRPAYAGGCARTRARR